MKAYIFFLALFLSCSGNSNYQTGSQGITGKVLWLEGNFMPGPGQTKTGKPIEKELYFFPVLNIKDISGSGPFYELKDYKPVGKVKSDSKGQFKILLPIGVYSLFSKEDEGFYASVQDGEGNINPIEVKRNEYNEIVFKIDYKAAY